MSGLNLEMVILMEEAELVKTKANGMIFGDSYNVIKRRRKTNKSH